MDRGISEQYRGPLDRAGRADYCQSDLVWCHKYD